MGALETASVRTTQNNGRIWQQFWSCHQRFFKLFYEFIGAVGLGGILLPSS